MSYFGCLSSDWIPHPDPELECYEYEPPYCNWNSNMIGGALFQMGSNDGYANSITVERGWADNDIVAKCLIYDSAGMFVGATEERQLMGGAGKRPETFYFTEPYPILIGGASYYLLLWNGHCEDITVPNCGTSSGVTYYAHPMTGYLWLFQTYDYQDHNGIPPQTYACVNPMYCSAFADCVPHIFCEYTEGEPPTPPPPQDCINPDGEEGALACINGFVHVCSDGQWVPTSEPCEVGIPPWVIGAAAVCILALVVAYITKGGVK